MYIAWHINMNNLANKQTNKQTNKSNKTTIKYEDFWLHCD